MTCLTKFARISALSGLALLAPLAGACGSSHMLDPDGGGAEVDSGFPEADSGAPGEDAGAPEVDAGPPPREIRCAPMSAASVGEGCFCDGPMARSGSTIYRGAFMLEVIDWSELDAPRVVGTMPSEGRVANDLEVEGDLLFVGGDFDRDLSIYDISSPLAPRLIYAREGGDSEWIMGLDVQGDRLLTGAVLADSGVLRLFDVSDPAAPAERLVIPTVSGLNDVLFGEGILIATAHRGIDEPDLLLTFDADTGEELGRVELESRAFRRRVALSGSIAYLLNGDSVLVLDLSDPRRPVETSSLPIERFASGIAVEGGLLLVGDSGALRVADLFDPRAPVWVGAGVGESDINFIESTGGYAMVSGGGGARSIALMCREGMP